MTIAEKLQKIYDNTPVVYEKGNLDTLEKVYNRNFTNEDIKFPEDTTSIGNYAYAGCENLTSITLPEQIKSIGEKAFLDCINLRTIDCAWKRDTIPGAPWGATNAEIKYKLNTANLTATIKLKSFNSEGVGAQSYYLYDEVPSSNFEIIVAESKYYDRSVFFFYILLPDTYSETYFYITNNNSWNPMSPRKLDVQTFHYAGVSRKGWKPTYNEAMIYGSHDKSWDEIINAFDLTVSEILSYGDFYGTYNEEYSNVESHYRIGTDYELYYDQYEHTGNYEISLSNIPSIVSSARLIDKHTDNYLDISIKGEETLVEQFTITYNTPDSFASEADLFYYMLEKNYASTITNSALKFVYNKFSTEILDSIGPYTDTWNTDTQFSIEY